MGWTILEFEETPNPNAVKCRLDAAVVASGSRSFLRPEDGAGVPLAEELFAVEGVAGLLFVADWVTVNKRADVPWGPLKRAVRKVLAGAVCGPGGLEGKAAS